MSPNELQPPLAPRELESLLASGTPVESVPGRNISKAEVLFFRCGTRRVAVKTYSRRPLWVRLLVGRWLIRREIGVYRAAAGIVGIPTLLGWSGDHTLATEWVDARPLPSFHGRRLGSDVFAALERILKGLHARGIAAGDLHHRDVLLAEDGGVYLVDFAAAWRAEEGSGPLRKWLVRRFQELDWIALARMRARWTGGDPAAAVAEFGGPMAAWHRRGRRLKRVWDRLRGKRRRGRHDAARPGNEESGE